MTLPAAPDDATYWRDVYHLPLPAWERALAQIAVQHGLPGGRWQRFSLGRNVVFGTDDIVVKLGPPFWAEDIPAGAAALRFVSDRLPVATAALLGEGTLDGWGYLIQTRLPDTLLHDIWPDLTPQERASIAFQHGALMAALHALPTADAPAILRRDWPLVIGGQWENCLEGLRRSAVPEPLLDDAPAYLAPMQARVLVGEPAVLLHGDLNFLNLLVERASSGWKIAGLLDWSDVALGPMAHELISPGVHMYRGDRTLLHRWYDGYGLAAERRNDVLQHEAMARAMLWYAGEFGEMLERVPGSAACQRWSEVADCFWHMEHG
jgi:hygromycin-B 7''-O-kinase